MPGITMFLDDSVKQNMHSFTLYNKLEVEVELAVGAPPWAWCLQTKNVNDPNAQSHKPLTIYLHKTFDPHRSD